MEQVKLQEVVTPRNVTAGTAGPVRKIKRKRGLLDWLVSTFRPGFHIARNPAKGVKKARKVKTDDRLK
jgi:hypothetical protein